jgi:microcin C transport system substrate-binding protein
MAALAGPSGQWAHAYAAFGDPKYPRGFLHFDYANPDAPKGGTLHLRNPDRRSSFDKFNPYTVRGNAPAGVSIFMFEPLAIMGADEPKTMYGLIAEEMLVAADKSSVTFRINSKARFNNGDVVSAEDVMYSYKQVSGPQAAPDVRSDFDAVAGAAVLDDRTIRFDLKEKTNDAVFTVAPMASPSASTRS